MEVKDARKRGQRIKQLKKHKRSSIKAIRKGDTEEWFFTPPKDISKKMKRKAIKKVRKGTRQSIKDYKEKHGKVKY
tara:strand:+ start:86 stop:313 length:228 start_codon:yes stop_codon:yes gene_type:complete